jgi:ribosome-associated toxin RatA of RatAB toxin-antitoxin module
MRYFAIHTLLPSTDPAAVFGTLTAFERYPRHATTVRSVVVSPDTDGRTVSDWEVDFRGGILRWVEEDVFDAERLRIEFNQITGDIDVFTGYWQVAAGPEGCTVEFGCWFDLGIPTMDDILDPIAEDAINENIAAIMEGLFGPGTRTLSAHGVQATPADLPAFAVSR